MEHRWHRRNLGSADKTMRNKTGQKLVRKNGFKESWSAYVIRSIGIDMEVC